MTIASQIQALQAVHRAISGISKAPDGTSTYPIPGAVNGSNDLPMVLLSPASTDVSVLTQDSTDQVNVFDGIVLVAALASGQGITDTVTTCWTVASALAERYRTMLGNDERIDSNTALVMRYQSENEPQEVAWRGGNWVGFSFTVTVWSIT